MILCIITLVNTQTYTEAASQWNNMPSNQCLVQKSTKVIVFELACLFCCWVRNNSPKSNIDSKECMSNTDTPAHSTKMEKNRRYKKYSIFLPVVYYRHAFLLPMAEERGLLRGGFNIPLRWRHNGHVGVSNHQPHHCLLNDLVGRRLKKTSKLCVTGLCVGNSLLTGEFPAQMASNAKRLSFDDVIMPYVLSPDLTKSRSREVCV